MFCVFLFQITQGGFAQQATPHDMNKPPMAAHVPAGPGQSNQQTIQTQMMYQNSQPPPPRVSTPVSDIPTASVQCHFFHSVIITTLFVA